jgi:steroid delta-isomerase-like uncharacterized protein
VSEQPTAHPSAADVARKYFAAISAQDLDAAVDCWAPGAIDNLAPVGELRVPGEMRSYFEQVFAAFPDFRYELLDVVAGDRRVAVRWRAEGTFTGRPFEGIRANGARVRAEGADVLRVENGLIQRNDSYWDSAAVGRHIGLFPARGSAGERVLTAAFNALTAVRKLFSRLARRR